MKPDARFRVYFKGQFAGAITAPDAEAAMATAKQLLTIRPDLGRTTKG